MNRLSSMHLRHYSQFVNIALRGMTLASKFLLIFFLARFLDPTDLGLYGLLAATIGYSLYLLGFDFYTYTTRELIKCERGMWGAYLKSQAALTLVLYAVFLPLLSLVFFKGLLPLQVAGWFFTLLVLEHLTQELGRLLVAVSDQMYASLLLFLRSGVWGVIATGVMFIDFNARTLNFVLAAWTLGSASALVLGIYRLKCMRLSGWKTRVDWSWIVKGLKVAVALLVATLAIRGVFTIDRYWTQHLVGLDVLGAYVLFMGICSALISFLDAGVFAFIYPGLVSSFQRQDACAYRRGVRKLFVQTVSLSGCFCIIAFVSISPLLSWLDKPIYLAQLEIFPWLLLATLLYALGMIPHFALYAQGQDRPIIYSHIASLAVFIAATWMIAHYWVPLAVPLGLCASFLSILCWKSWSYFRMTAAQYRIF